MYNFNFVIYPTWMGKRIWIAHSLSTDTIAFDSCPVFAFKALVLALRKRLNDFGANPRKAPKKLLDIYTKYDSDNKTKTIEEKCMNDYLEHLIIGKLYMNDLTHLEIRTLKVHNKEAYYEFIEHA